MWKHKTMHKNQKFKGRYKRMGYGDRVFELVNIKTGRVITMESWQMAKKLGWIKL
jgi:hypothetical protein